jgi:chaperonin GroES
LIAVIFVKPPAVDFCELMVVNAAPSTPAHAFTGTTQRERNQGMAGFRPLHDRVLVKRVEAEEKTPDTAKEKPVEGEVLAVGPGARDETGTVRPLDVKVGDHVLFGKWAGTEVIIDGQDRLILKETDILGVIERDAHAPAKAA